jgi:signal transduction histidine kinase
MSRAEFAKFGNATAVNSPLREPTTQADLPSQPERKPLAGRDIRVLLFDEDPSSAATIRGMLHESFGDRSISDWFDNREEAIERVKQNEHDVHLCVDGPNSGNALALLRASTDAGNAAPIIVLAPAADPGADLKTVDAGAADYVALDDLSPAALARSIRHALIRHDRLAKAQHEIEGLTGEKLRLNMLRDANHRIVENACHDFRSPLTVIKEFASIIAEGLTGEINEEQTEFLEIILTRVDQLSQMVDGILDASRLESDVIGVKREEQSVASLVEKVRPTLEQKAAAHKVAIEFAIPDTLPHVFADAESIGRVIVNLGTNAAKYAGENGNIRVWARYNSETGDMTIGVTDSGPGIAPEHVKLIFDRFHQIPDDKKREKDGFGLGLHIASEFVRVNFGTLMVESEPQKGSTFAFTLPVFDVDRLVPLHFEFLKTSRHSFQNVAIALATAEEADIASYADAERLLNRQLRSYDLLLRVRPGNWLVCVACDEGELSQISDRILSAYSESSRARPEKPLPDMRFRPIGMWALASRPDALRDAIHGVYDPAAERPVTH